MNGVLRFNITSGVKKEKPVKIVVYGAEGIGKTTFASQFPNPIFIDTEGSTDLIDVKRFDRPQNWETLLAMVEASKDIQDMQTLVIDTGDWANRLCEEFVCRKAGKGGIEDFGYGKGYTYAREEFSHLLDKLNEIIDAGKNVVVTAHATIRKFELPEESGAFDRYELKMGAKAGNQCAALLKEWADCVFFVNYREKVVEIDGKKKAQGGARMMFTTHAPSWDAKNRFGLPDVVPFEYKSIEQFIPGGVKEAPQAVTSAPKKTTRRKKAAAPSEEAPKEEKVEIDVNRATDVLDRNPAAEAEDIYAGIDPRIVPLMQRDEVTPEELSAFAKGEGCLPTMMPVKGFPPAFIEQVILAQWDKVKDCIKEKYAVPFK